MFNNIYPKNGCFSVNDHSNLNIYNLRQKRLIHQLSKVREVISAIACFCRVNFEDMNASTSKELFETAYQQHKRGTHTIIGMSQRDLNKISDIPHQWGLVRIIKESEFQGRQPIEAILNTKLQIKDLKTGQTIDVEAPEEKAVISPLVTIPPGPLDQWLDPRRRLVRVFQRVMSRKEELYACKHREQRLELDEPINI